MMIRPSLSDLISCYTAVHMEYCSPSQQLSCVFERRPQTRSSMEYLAETLSNKVTWRVVAQAYIGGDDDIILRRKALLQRVFLDVQR